MLELYDLDRAMTTAGQGSGDWREGFLRRFGPGVLCGITLRDWSKLVWRERGQIEAPYLPRVCAITFQSLKTSLIGFLENKRYGPRFQNVTIQPPLSN